MADALPQIPTYTDRADIADGYKWQLSDIYPDWSAWDEACQDLATHIEAFPRRQGTLGDGPEQLLGALKATDALGQLAYKVYYYVALRHDEDQRDNEVGGRKQRVDHLLAQWAQATAWFNPEVLTIPLATVRDWLDETPDLATYRFALEELFRLQEHVLDEGGERILSLAARVDGTAHEVYEALSTADIRYPHITLSNGETVQVTYGKYRALLEQCREQSDRAAAFAALHETFATNANTYASLYNGVTQRDVFSARARKYDTTLDAALFGNAIPPAVVETLIATTRAGVAPLQRYQRLRRRALGLDQYHVYDGQVPLVDHRSTYRYDDVLDWVAASTAPLGSDYEARMRRGFAGRWIDVYETPGKRSGAYSAPVYGVHPYMLLNWNGTLDGVFTLAHEMGHSMHTQYAHEAQPFVYSGYTIFVAEVPSTLSEALLLDYLLARTDDPRERVVLLQHAIDEIVGTFYTQVMFADWELQVHRFAEAGEPITAESLGDSYMETLRAYHGDSLDYDDLSRVTWARIPHFFGSPYYVYQYATCYASTAHLVQGITQGSPESRCQAVGRYLDLLKAGSCDHPMTLLKRAGVDLAEAATIQAVVDQFDRLVTQLDDALAALQPRAGGRP